MLMLCSGGIARAQIYVDLKMETETAVAYEPVKAVVIIQNRSGADVHLRGPAGTSWLNFQIHDGRRNLVAPYPDRAIPKPELLKAGKNLSLRIPVNAMYPVNEVGGYRITASVYYEPLRTFFDSPARHFTVDDGRALWSRVVGSAGAFQRHSLLSFRDRTETRLYYRLSDDQTGIVRKTFSLGKLVNYRDPQVAVDGRGNVHVLHMGAPQQHVHTVIGPDGTVDGQKKYDEAAGNLPKIVQDEGGGVRIDGGITPEDKAKEKQERLGELSKIRRLSERPYGF